MDLTEFIYQSNQCTTIETLIDLYTRFINQFGYDQFLFARVSPSSPGEQNDINMDLMVNYPEDWMNHYREHNYHHHDPVYQLAMTAVRPFTWKEIQTRKLSQYSQRVMNEAKEHGLISGLGIPLRSSLNSQMREHQFGVGLSCSEQEITIDTNIMSILNAASHHLFFVYLSLQKVSANPRKVQLTPREKEVLLWISYGKTKTETADKLCVSESCIKRHCEHLLEKLNVNNLTAAVAKAFRLGVIELY